MIRFALSLFAALVVVFVFFRVAQNQATRAWSAGYAAGRTEAEHDIALHWYRLCLYNGPYEDERIDWHDNCDRIFESQLGFKNRWRGEMP